MDKADAGAGGTRLAGPGLVPGASDVLASGTVMPFASGHSAFCLGARPGGRCCPPRPGGGCWQWMWTQLGQAIRWVEFHLAVPTQLGQHIAVSAVFSARLRAAFGACKA